MNKRFTAPDFRLAAAIGMARRVRGMSQSKLARELGVSQTRVHRLEHGVFKVRESEREKLVALFPLLAVINTDTDKHHQGGSGAEM